MPRNLRRYKKIFFSSGLIMLLSGSAVSVATAVKTGGKESLAPAGGSSSAEKALQSFCQQYWGNLSEDGTICLFEQTFHLNLTRVGEKVVITRIPLEAGDEVRIRAWNMPDALLGAHSYGTESNRFIAAAAGYLSFRPMPRQKLFSVQTVRVERCFAVVMGSVQSVACPQN